MKKKLSRHDQEIAYILHTREGISQKKLSAMYDVSPAAMSSYIKEMKHIAEKSALFNALAEAYQTADPTRQLPTPDIVIENGGE